MFQPNAGARELKPCTEQWGRAMPRMPQSSRARMCDSNLKMEIRRHRSNRKPTEALLVQWVGAVRITPRGLPETRDKKTCFLKKKKTWLSQKNSVVSTENAIHCEKTASCLKCWHATLALKTQKNTGEMLVGISTSHSRGGPAVAGLSS